MWSFQYILVQSPYFGAHPSKKLSRMINQPRPSSPVMKKNRSAINRTIVLEWLELCYLIFVKSIQGCLSGLKDYPSKILAAY